MSSSNDEKKNINRFLTEWKGKNTMVVNEINTIIDGNSILVFKKWYRYRTQACLMTVSISFDGHHRFKVCEKDFDYIPTEYLLSKKDILLKMEMYEDQNFYTQDELQRASEVACDIEVKFM